jgi:hypothetical protein
MDEAKKPITIKVKIGVNANPHGIPQGTLIDVVITIIDEYETIKTSDFRFTRDLAKVAPKDAIARYSDRLQKTIVKYPNKTQLEIFRIVSEDLKKIQKVN